jgi:hypothetical protein
MYGRMVDEEWVKSSTNGCTFPLRRETGLPAKIQWRLAASHDLHTSPQEEMTWMSSWAFPIIMSKSSGGRVAIGMAANDEVGHQNCQFHHDHA